VGTRILDGWESVLDSLGGDQSFAARVVDWVAKRRIIDAHCARHGHHPTSPSARAIDLQYHDLRPDRGLAARAGMLRVADDDAVARAIVSPPPSTRAYLRGSVIGRGPAAILSCNWDGMVIALNGDRTVRIGLDDPLAWSADRAAEMLAGCATPEDLVRSVGAHRPLDR
jgi:proteasome accessory factor A